MRPVTSSPTPTWLSLLLGLLLAASLAGCKDDAPTTILLHVSLRSGAPFPAALTMSVYTAAGRVVDGKRLPEQASTALTLPATVVLYPAEQRGTVRVHVRALDAADHAIADATTSVELVTGKQVEASVELGDALVADRDGDGVPDAIDDCPDVPNPEQRGCGADAGVDASGDGPRDAGPDGQDAGPDHDGRADAPVDAPVDTAPDIAPDLGCTCPLGCHDGGACREIVPANGGLPSTVFGGAVNINGTKQLAVDTTSCTAPAPLGNGQLGSAVGGACIYQLTSFEITNAASLTATGDRPLIFIVRDGVTISGTLDAGGKGAKPGPGGGAGGMPGNTGPGVVGSGPGGGKVCVCPITGSDDCGGGGGGFGELGGAGGPEGACSAGSPPTSMGGLAYGSPTLEPLVGGSGGASAGQQPGDVFGADGRGGGGGGALQISCLGPFTLDGTILAGGGGGGAGVKTAPLSGVAAGGGGSGGAVLLEASHFTGAGLVAVNGGGGGGATHVSSCPVATRGEDGGAQRAAGGTAGGICSAGGAGGTGTIPPVAADTADGAGGGGGGGAGRIRFNWYQHKSTPNPLSTSGVVSYGEVTLR